MELFRQAFTIMVLGMALVFAFLALVILAVNLAARIIHRIEGAPREEGDEAGRDELGLRRRVAAVAVAVALRRESRGD
jgi:sodium pump decarboxylase gamma subunit